MLQPSIKQMLYIGKGCGLETLDEAYSQYMLHYDLFFLIKDYVAQYNKFIEDLTALGWVENVTFMDFTLKDLTIDQALEQLDK